MNKSINEKILLIDDLINIIKKLRQENNKIVQCHGVYDVIHPGVINHFNEARQQGTVLVVTVIRDRDVRRGPGRPIFSEQFRAQNVASLHVVDYVCVVDDETPYDCLKRIKPDIFAKSKQDGQAKSNQLSDIEKELYFNVTNVYETSGFHLTSNEIITKFLNIYPKNTQAFLYEFAKKYNYDYILNIIESVKDIKVLIIGDGIIDEYCYCESMGKSPKSQIIVNKAIDTEVFAGGVFAIANHVSGICENVHIASVLGLEDSREEFIKYSLRPKVKYTFFYQEDAPTVIKRRYINNYNKQKIFEVNYIKDDFIDGVFEDKIIDSLKGIIHNYDLTLVSDFGHGFITNKIIKFIEENSKTVAVNTQTNGANYGYNMITKYRAVNFVCLDAHEARLATQEKYTDIEDVGKKLMETSQFKQLMITLGAQGSIFFTEDGIINRTPALSTNVVDIIGAGDAFFSYTAPCLAAGMHVDAVSFIGNVVGALAVQIVGNKRAVEKFEVLESIRYMLP